MDVPEGKPGISQIVSGWVEITCGKLKRIGDKIFDFENSQSGLWPENTFDIKFWMYNQEDFKTADVLICTVCWQAIHFILFKPMLMYPDRAHFIELISLGINSQVKYENVDNLELTSEYLKIHVIINMQFIFTFCIHLRWFSPFC